MVNRLLRRPSVLLLASALAASVMGVSVAATLDPKREHIVMGGSFPAVSVAELFERADAVAIVRPSSDVTQHWNNATNTKWTSDTAARMALIVTDQVVDIDQVIKGELPGSITIRLPGGTVRETTFDSALKPLSADVEYLLFLDWTDTPTEQGSERAWTIYMGPVGKFERNEGGAWVNHAEGNIITAIEELDSD